MNTRNVSCHNATIVQSIEPIGWRTAMTQLKSIFYPLEQSSCHYPNEQRIALVLSSDRIYLISQQTYPHNRTAENHALTCITGLIVVSGKEDPVVNLDFGMDGIALYQPQATKRLPFTAPHFTSINDDYLCHLYKEEDGPILALFDLSQPHGMHCMNKINTEGNSVQ